MASRSTETVPRSTDAATPWHTMDAAAVLDQCGSTSHGLSEAEAAQRLARHGPNELPRKPPPGFHAILARQFASPLIYILAVAALASLAIGEAVDAAFIATVLLLNAAIGGVQEWRAERSAQALQQLLRIRATVERDGESQDVAADQLVPGDVVWLESGVRVPADLRLLMAHGFRVDESLLTGESLAVTKDAAWLGEAGTALADRLNMAHAGTIVSIGRARGVVVATGKDTAVGQLALEVAAADAGQPPLMVRMAAFTRAVSIAILGAAIVIGALGVAVQGYTVVEMFLFAVALVVSAIPEGLPVALTVVLAISSSRMARRGVIVRRLAAVEGLGSCSHIASDKTGTLTANELTVREAMLADGTVYAVAGQGYAPEGAVTQDEQALTHPLPEHHPLLPLARTAVLCNEADLHRRNGAWIWHGDPTEIALLSLGEKLGVNRAGLLERYPQVNQIPFEPERKYAATYHQTEVAVQVFVKGAPERVLAMCDLGGGEAGETRRETLHAQAEAMAARGYRVLALAEGFAPGEVGPESQPSEPHALRLLGFVGMIDPLREGVREAVATCHRAGIAVAMVTGDHPVTALAIARDLGLAESQEQVLTGGALEAMTPEQLAAELARVRVFARVAPSQKLDIVQALQARGAFVTVTGDGVNDAPALRQANIGLAMGASGTDVAREAADLVISDDNFATILGGVEEGRIAYDNIRKVIYLLVSTGAAEVVMVGLAVALGLPLPLAAVQLLWLNLVTNGIQHIGLAFEPGETGVLERQPRPSTQPIFNRLMLERTLVAAAVMGVVGFGLFATLLRLGWSEPAARNVLLLLFVLFENIHIGNCRSEVRSAFRLSPLRSPILLVGTLTAFTIHVTMMHLPIGTLLLEAEPVSAGTWLLVLALASTVLWTMEVHKLLWRRRYGLTHWT